MDNPSQTRTDLVIMNKEKRSVKQTWLFQKTKERKLKGNERLEKIYMDNSKNLMFHGI